MTKKQVNKIEEKIFELYLNMQNILKKVDTLSMISQSKDICSPMETAWRKINELQGQIQSLQWAIENL